MYYQFNYLFLLYSHIYFLAFHHANNIKDTQFHFYYMLSNFVGGILISPHLLAFLHPVSCHQYRSFIFQTMF